MMLKTFTRGIFTVFLVVFLLGGCGEKSYVKPGVGAGATPASDVVIDYSELLNNLQLEYVESKSPDAISVGMLKQVADRHATGIWGPEVARGTPLQLVDAEDEPVLYAFPYAIGDRKFPTTDELIKQFSKLQRTGGTSNKAKSKISAAIPSIVEAEAARYGTIYVSARKRDFPVTRVSHALHPYFYNAERALSHVGEDAAKLVKLRYLPPHEFFEIRKQDSTLRLHTHMLMSEEEIRAAAEKFTGTPEPKAVTAKPAPSYTKQIAEAWKAYEQPAPAHVLTPETPLPPPPSPGGIEFRIRQWERMPAINWTCWCEPTAASMVFAFWDHYVPVPGIGTHVGYDRIVDYWFNHSSNGNNVPDIIDPIAAGPNIDVANTLKGYNWTVNKVHGNSSNDYAWNELVGSLHNNRPVVWHVFRSASWGHAVSAFGYRILNGQKYVILYTGWSEDPNMALQEWLYNEHDGVPLARVEVDLYVPGGKELYRYLFVRRPYGEETYHVGQWNEILFHVHPQTDIKKARIEHSIDGGQSWSLVVEVWVQPGWNQWWWRPVSTSNKARIRIRGMSENGIYLGGDGSFKNFNIQ